MMSNPERTQPPIPTLVRLSQAVATNIAQNQLTALGQNLSLAQDDLRALGSSNSRIDALIETANQAGSLGTKLTGGGRWRFALLHWLKHKQMLNSLHNNYAKRRN